MAVFDPTQIRPFRARAVLFDFDGTLTAPGALDFPAIKRDLGCPADEPILEYLAGIGDPDVRRRLEVRLEVFEAEAALRSGPNEGAEELVRAVRRRGLATGIVTRNGQRAVAVALLRFPHLGLEDFDVVVTRDVPLAHKPAPDGLLHAAEELGISAEEMVMVGDHWLDVGAGTAAGCVTVFVENRGAEDAAGPGDALHTFHTPERGGHAAPDFTVARLPDVDDVVRLGVPLPAGKVPAYLLGAFLEGLAERSGGDLLLAPRVGEDVAAAAYGGGAVVMKSDPITFTADDLATYAVAVNANDVAASGATPRWFLATVLFPPGTTGSEVVHLLSRLEERCRGAGVELVGGHSEITDAVARTVVAGSLVATAEPGDLVDKSGIAPGDRIVLTKRLAVEGTAVLARELGEELASAGFGDDDLGAARSCLRLISVVPEARVAARAHGVTGMHDVTEGGLATALRELSSVSGCAVHADLASVPMFGVTRRMASCLGFDPVGLIGSGSLLVTVRPEGATALQEQIGAAGIEAAIIGRIGSPREGSVPVLLDTSGTEWPAFEVDEAARLLVGSAAPPPA